MKRKSITSYYFPDFRDQITLNEMIMNMKAVHENLTKQRKATGVHFSAQVSQMPENQIADIEISSHQLEFETLKIAKLLKILRLNWDIKSLKFCQN